MSFGNTQRNTPYGYFIFSFLSVFYPTFFKINCNVYKTNDVNNVYIDTDILQINTFFEGRSNDKFSINILVENQELFFKLHTEASLTKICR